MNSIFFKLDENKNVVPCDDIDDWVEFHNFRNIENRRVARDEIDGYEISTVFLGTPHGFSHGDHPLLFETMIFYGQSDFDEYMTRCSTYEEALEMHKKAIEWVKNGGKDE